MMNMFKPERIVKTYYEGLEAGKILGRRCPECGAVEYPPVSMCNECGCDELEWVDMPLAGLMGDFVVQSPLSSVAGFTGYGPYGFGCIEVEGVVGDRNFPVFGISRENQNELRGRVEDGGRIPVEAVIVQSGPTKVVGYKLAGYEFPSNEAA